MSIIRDINLAPSGENKIEWVRRNCPLLRSLEEDFSGTKPFAGKRIALSIHLGEGFEKADSPDSIADAVLALRKGGAQHE